MEAKFKDLWTRVNGKEDPTVVFETLNSLYSQPHRFYHNLTHIDHCLRELSSVKSFAKDYDSLELAIWYHDAVYETRKDDNEEKSAELAKEICEKNNFTDDFTTRIYKLILSTKHCGEPNDPDEKIMLDIDLAILGQEQDIFKEYEDNIRKEYIYVPKEIFNPKRSEILQSFLDRKSIYLTDYFKDKYEEIARDNIKKSIKDLL